ncbi:MAG: hypothetical protein LBR80_11575 [Deltaproteobacteria bacterium]|jgi:hypothetical protein|nr:hypothetical protein [Deltaproteobacteria bacterium]
MAKLAGYRRQTEQGKADRTGRADRAGRTGKMGKLESANNAGQTTILLNAALGKPVATKLFWEWSYGYAVRDVA